MSRHFVNRAGEIPGTKGLIEVFPRNEKTFQQGKGWAMSEATEDDDGVLRFDWMAIERQVAEPEPDFGLFYELAALSPMWRHISTYAQVEADRLHTAITASKPNILVVQGFMLATIAALGEEKKLTTATTDDGKVMSEILDEWLEACSFPFRYANLEAALKGG